MEQIRIVEADATDADGIVDLFREVASFPGGLARLAAEIDTDYVQRIMQSSAKTGLMLLALHGGGGQRQILGSIHGYVPPLYCFSHVMSELTIAVHPQHQGQGIGRQLFTTFMARIEFGFLNVTRVELITRESNRKAIAFYETMGFVKEGELTNRIKNVDGSLENDIPMAWTR